MTTELENLDVTGADLDNDGNPNTPDVTQADPVITKAREMGWVPKEEFDGDETTWVDAKEFVGRAPLYEGLSKANREVKNLRKQLEAVVKFQQQIKTKAYEDAKRDLLAQRKAAIENNDVEAALEINDKITQLNDTTKPSNETTVSEVPNTVFQNWLAKNKWYETDTKLKAFADGIGMQVYNQDPSQSLEDLYAEVERIVKEEFPHKFQNPARKRPAAVAAPAGGGGTGKKSTTPGYSNLPEEAKPLYRALVKSERNPGGSLTHEEFMKEYMAVGGPTINAE